MIKKLVDWEEDRWNALTERAAERQPEAFWNDDVPNRGWELFVMNHWPRYLTFSYWYYIFGNLAGTRYDDSFPNWINLPEWGEWRYLGRSYRKPGIYKFSLRWAWIQLTDETKGTRLICRLRGHPNGEIYYNSGGDEPDHRCKDCGEEIG